MRKSAKCNNVFSLSRSKGNDSLNLSDCLEDSDGHRLADFLFDKNCGPVRRHVFIDFVPDRFSLNIDIAKIKVPAQEHERPDTEQQPNTNQLSLQRNNLHENGQNVATNKAASPAPIQKQKEQTLDIENKAPVSTKSGGRVSGRKSLNAVSPGDLLRRHTLRSQSLGRRALLSEFENTTSSSQFLPPICSTPLSARSDTMQPPVPESVPSALLPAEPNTGNKDRCVHLQSDELISLLNGVVNKTQLMISEKQKENSRSDKQKSKNKSASPPSPSMSDGHKRTFTLEKGSVAGQLMLTPTKRSAVELPAGQSVAKSPHSTTNADDKASKATEIDLAELNEHITEPPNTQEILESARTILNSPQKSKRKEHNRSSTRQCSVRKSNKATSMTLRRDPVDTLISEDEDALLASDKSKTCGEVNKTGTSKPLDLAASQSHKLQHADVTSAVYKCGAPRAHALNLRRNNHNVSNRHNGREKKIPLNKAPRTPINGEKFAGEMKQNLARMTNYEIIDLRKRNSMGKVFFSSKLQNEQHRLQLEEELILEMNKRKLQVDENSEEVLPPLTPPSQFVEKPVEVEELKINSARLKTPVKKQSIATITSVALNSPPTIVPTPPRVGIMHTPPVVSPPPPLVSPPPTVVSPPPPLVSPPPPAVSPPPPLVSAPPTVVSPSPRAICATPTVVKSPPPVTLPRSPSPSPPSAVSPPPVSLPRSPSASPPPPPPPPLMPSSPPRSPVSPNNFPSAAPVFMSFADKYPLDIIENEECVTLSQPTVNRRVKRKKSMDEMVKQYLNVSKCVRKSKRNKLSNTKRSLYNSNSSILFDELQSPERRQDGTLLATNGDGAKALCAKSTCQSGLVPPPKEFVDDVAADIQQPFGGENKQNVFKVPNLPVRKKKKKRQSQTENEVASTENTITAPLRRSQRSHIPVVENRWDLYQTMLNNLTQKRDRVLEKQRLRQQTSKISSNPYSLLGDTNATNNTVNSLNSCASLTRALSPIPEPQAIVENASTTAKETPKSSVGLSPKRAKTRAKKTAKEKQTTKTKQGKKSTKAQKAKEQQSKSKSVDSSGFEHSRLELAAAPVDQLNLLFEHHKGCSEAADAELGSVCKAMSSTSTEQTANTSKRQLRVRIRRLKANRTPKSNVSRTRAVEQQLPSSPAPSAPFPLISTTSSSPPLPPSHTPAPPSEQEQELALTQTNIRTVRNFN